MILKTVACAAIISMVFTSQAIFAQTLTYKNTRGSVLELQVDSKDTLSGTFTTAVASKECQQVIGTKRPVTGYITNNTITISISYPDCGSVVTFIGNMDTDKKTIDTTAVAAHPNPVFAQGSSTQLISHDTFKQQ